MSHDSGNGKGNGAHRPFPSFSGIKEGFTGYFTGRVPPKIPSYMPEQEVRDAFTIGRERGFSEPHQQAKQNVPAPLVPSARKSHDDAFGYVVGTASAMALTALALRRGRVHVPQLKYAQWANAAVGVNNLLSLPNTLNQRVKTTQPVLHEHLSKEMHTEAESIRNKK